MQKRKGLAHLPTGGGANLNITYSREVRSLGEEHPLSPSQPLTQSLSEHVAGSLAAHVEYPHPVQEH
ncbi:UNVERIFIED_CONTAM: hypothetical protein Slati_1421000 [Sesamum latifolium]|uniref:Uncharacterized protein n=1 Tax=Sesamum latifolium TaxID=2727402 RepID=A0AAW2X930_9LAMI